MFGARSIYFLLKITALVQLLIDRHLPLILIAAKRPNHFKMVLFFELSPLACQTIPQAHHAFAEAIRSCAGFSLKPRLLACVQLCAFISVRLGHLHAARIQLIKFGTGGRARFIDMRFDARKNIFSNALAGLFNAVQCVGLSKTGVQLFRFLGTSPSKVTATWPRRSPRAK